MAVTAPMADQLPSVCLDDLDDIPYFHDLPTVANNSTFEGVPVHVRLAGDVEIWCDAHLAFFFATQRFATSLRDAFAAVSSTRRCLVSGFLALCIHSSTMRWFDRENDLKFAAAPGKRRKATPRSAGISSVSTLSSLVHAPDFFAISIVFSPVGWMRPAFNNRPTRPLFFADQPLVALRGEKYNFDRSLSTLPGRESIHPQQIASSTISSYLTPPCVLVERG